MKSTLLSITTILILLCSFLFFSEKSTDKDLRAAQIELDSMPAKIAALDAKLNEKITELEIQKGINAEQDYKINEQLMQLEAQKETITLVKKLTKEKNYPEANRVLNKYLEAYPQ